MDSPDCVGEGWVEELGAAWQQVLPRRALCREAERLLAVGARPWSGELDGTVLQAQF